MTKLIRIGHIRKLVRPMEIPDNGLVSDLLWSDPDRGHYWMWGKRSGCLFHVRYGCCQDFSSAKRFKLGRQNWVQSSLFLITLYYSYHYGYYAQVFIWYRNILENENLVFHGNLVLGTPGVRILVKMAKYLHPSDI